MCIFKHMEKHKRVVMRSCEITEIYVWFALPFMASGFDYTATHA